MHPIVLLVPGQGAQHRGMAVDLYERDRDFAAVADEFLAALGPDGPQLRDEWLNPESTVDVTDGRWAQPLLFLVGYAVGTSLVRRGARLATIIGHSIGELAAAALAGVFDLAAAGRMMVARRRAIAEAPPGGMLAVAAPPELVTPFVTGDVVIGAHNGPRQTLLAGPEEPLREVECAMRSARLTCRRIASRNAWHSPAVEPCARQFTEAVAAETLRPPSIAVVSSRTGRLVTDEEASRPEFWGEQMATPVLFWPALSGLLARGGNHTLVETGPGTELSTPARRHPKVRNVVTLLPGKGRHAATAWRKGLTDLELT
jgi:[acyl-carrier-protein] S-malonyltransferase